MLLLCCMLLLTYFCAAKLIDVPVLKFLRSNYLKRGYLKPYKNFCVQLHMSFYAVANVMCVHQ